MAAPINVFAFTVILLPENIQQCLKALKAALCRPWYTVALRIMSRNYSNVANLKWSKFRIVLFLLSSFFSNQPSAVAWEVTHVKQQSIMRIFFKDYFLCLVWSETIVYSEHLPTIYRQCSTFATIAACLRRLCLPSGFGDAIDRPLWVQNYLMRFSPTHQTSEDI